MLTSLGVAAVLLTASLAASAARAAAAEIDRLLAGPTVHKESIAATALRRVYGELGNWLLWHSQPEPDRRRQLVEHALADVHLHGINDHDLHARALEGLKGAVSPEDIAARDLLLTDALLVYAAKLRRGTVPREVLGRDWHMEPEPFDPAAGLIAALRADRLASFLETLASDEQQYRLLREALASYRAIASAGGWPVVPGATEVKLDGGDERLPILQRRLAAEGYLGPEFLDLIRTREAVAEFQRRHGLDVDGRVGVKTLAALNRDVDERIAQIAANLERWRQFARVPRDAVIVNTAAGLVELRQNGEVVLRLRVIIGDIRHPTPVFATQITAVTFNPPWNVPPSIATKEILPRLKHNPGYLAANNIVVVGRTDDPFGRSIPWGRISAKQFPYRLQQIPGPKNSLGGLKFEMANPWNIYLHDTPAKALFDRAQRGFSHGCVRVQQPAELARRLLGDDGRWSAEAIEQAVASGSTRTVPLRQLVPVYIGYWTAFVDANRQVNFAPDLYGRDPAVERALGLAPAPAVERSSHEQNACSSPHSAPLSLG